MTQPYDVVTVVNTPSPLGYNLTDLETAKDELQIKDAAQDLWLTRGLTQISTAIANYCNRVFPVETITDTFYFARRNQLHQRSDNDDVLQLTRFPVVAMVSVVETAGDGTQVTLVQDTDYLVKATVGQLIRIDSTNNGLPCRWKCAKVAVQYAAGYGSEINEQHTVPATPFQITITAAASFAVDLGVTYANGSAFTKVAALTAVGQYTADTKGLYTFYSGDAAASVTINYAVTTIPDDLVDAALRLLTGRFTARGRDPMLMSRDLPTAGNERYWVGGAPGQSGAFPPEIAGLLDGKYRVPVVG